MVGQTQSLQLPRALQEFEALLVRLRLQLRRALQEFKVRLVRLKLQLTRAFNEFRSSISPNSMLGLRIV
jgi:hypothetical protein